MKFLFIHQHMPGQFGALASRLARSPGNQVVFLTQADRPPPAGCLRVLYRLARAPAATTHRYVRPLEAAVLAGQAVARACLALKERGFVPDLVMAHSGWGETLYVKDVFPSAKLVSYCEFFYRAAGADVGFDPEEVVDPDTAARVRTRNAHLLISLEACDRGISATEWQRSLHPREWRSKIETIFDGIDAERVRPDPDARLTLADGTVLSRAAPVVTYVARNLEPHRGFPSFMRALPAILEALPEVRVVVAGGDGVSYGRAPANGRTWRETMLAEVPLGADARRVFFTGTLPYADYVRLLQLSTAHVYLTTPFVLSWSAMEALAAGCVFVGSRTPPVKEIVEDGRNGFLVDFHAPDAIAAGVVEAVRRSAELDGMRRAARETIVGRYDLATCLPRQIDLFRRVTGREPLHSKGSSAEAAGRAA